MAVVITTVATAGSETTIDSFCGFREGQQVDEGSERSKKQKDWKRAKIGRRKIEKNLWRDITERKYSKSSK